MHLVAAVDPDQQCGQALDEAGEADRAGVDGAGALDLVGQRHDGVLRVPVGAGDQDVGIERLLRIHEDLRRAVVERAEDRRVRQDRGRLLGR